MLLNNDQKVYERLRKKDRYINVKKLQSGYIQFDYDRGSFATTPETRYHRKLRIRNAILYVPYQHYSATRLLYSPVRNYQVEHLDNILLGTKPALLKYLTDAMKG